MIKEALKWAPIVGSPCRYQTSLSRLTPLSDGRHSKLIVIIYPSRPNQTKVLPKKDYCTHITLFYIKGEKRNYRLEFPFLFQKKVQINNTRKTSVPDSTQGTCRPHACITISIVAGLKTGIIKIRWKKLNLFRIVRKHYEKGDAA